MEMLHQDYVKLVKGFDLIGEDDANRIIASVLDKTIESTGAIIADVWKRERGKNNVDIFDPIVCRGGQQGRSLEPVVVTPDAVGALCWVAETGKPLWLEDVVPNDSNVNRLDDEILNARYADFYDKTRSMIALPLVYRGSMRGIMTLEFATSGKLERYHLDMLQALAEPTAILIWKSEVCDDNRTQTKQAIEAFQTGLALPAASLNPYRTGFIARPFSDEFNLVELVISDAFKQKKIRASTYRQPPGGGMIFAELIPQVSGAHSGMVDVTHLNSNVMIELGAMIAFNKPFIVLRREDDQDVELPFNLRGYQCYLYEMGSSGVSIKEPPGRIRLLPDVVDEFVENCLMHNPTFVGALESPDGADAARRSGG